MIDFDQVQAGSPNQINDYFRAPFSSVAELCQRAEELCKFIVEPEFEDMPVYVVANSMLSREVRRTRCLGWTSGNLDVMLKHELRKRWRGRGVAMVINDHSQRRHADAYEEMCRDIGGPSSDTYFRNGFLTTAVHELAHILERPIPIGPDVVSTKEERARVSEFNRRDAIQPSAGPDAEIPWNQHDWQFIRLALHLQRRADHKGFYVNPNELAAGDKYGLSPSAAYRTALEPEFQYFDGKPFCEIRECAPPPEFVDLFKSDVRAYLSEEKTDDQQ